MSRSPDDRDDGTADGTDEPIDADERTPGDDGAGRATASSPDEPVENTPTVYCSRCDRTWELEYELESLYAGNQAFEQFALDHKRHTGHFPDDVTPWTVRCQQCPAGDRYLDEPPARRWAETHVRHTHHEVHLGHNDTAVAISVNADGTLTDKAVSEPPAEQ